MPTAHHRDVQFHPMWMLDAQHEAALSTGAELSFFWFSTTTESFAAIRRYRPAVVVTARRG